MLPQIRLDRAAAAPLHEQLGNELRRLILAGELPPGSHLPATRRAAAEMGVSRNVVVLAYEQLQLEGYLKAGVGIGTWVPESLDPRLLRPVGGPERQESRKPAPPPALSRRGSRLARHVPPMPATRPTRPFRPGTVAADLFPTKTWMKLQTRVWRKWPHQLVHYGEVQGLQRLRQTIADHLVRYRGVRCEPDQIMMTSGSQQSLDLTAQMLLDEGHTAGIEEPGYPGARAAFEGVGADLVPVGVDEAGMDVESAQDALEGARVLYTSPSHQYPLGVTLALERRLAMLAWADRTGAWVIEDDYDSEFRFEARPLPSLQGLDEKRRTIYVGTFSKILAPALRLGFLVLPPSLVEPFLRAREVMDNHPPTLTQAVLAEFMEAGHLERHIARMRTVYGERREILREALQRAFGEEEARIVPGDAGLHLCMLLEPSVDDRRVSSAAAAAGIDVEPLSSHYLSSARRPGLILGYGAYEPAELRAAVAVLERCVAEGRG